VAQTNGSAIGFEAAGNIVLGILDARLNTDRAGGTLTSQSGWGAVGIASAGGTILNAQARPAGVTNLYANDASLEADERLWLPRGSVHTTAPVARK